MKLKLERRFPRDTYTIGKLFIDGKYFCDTLEDKDRDLNKNGRFDNGETKVYAETAIPYGTYNIAVTYSPKFKRELPLLLNVPHFEGIRIHRGNTALDSAGCILVGENSQVGKVLNSTPYEERLTKMMKEASARGESITIDIV